MAHPIPPQATHSISAETSADPNRATLTTKRVWLVGGGLAQLRVDDSNIVHVGEQLMTIDPGGREHALVVLAIVPNIDDYTGEPTGAAIVYLREVEQ